MTGGGLSSKRDHPDSEDGSAPEHGDAPDGRRWKRILAFVNLHSKPDSGRSIAWMAPIVRHLTQILCTPAVIAHSVRISMFVWAVA